MQQQPVIVGVGEVVGDRGRDPARAREPAVLIEQACRDAAADALAAGPAGTAAGGAGAAALLAAVDAVHHVRTSSWSTAEAARGLAARLGAEPHHLADTAVGGHWPTRLLDAAAARIAAGEDRIALVVGGEAQAAVTALQRAGIDPVADLGWSAEPGGPPAFDPDDLGTPAMLDAGVVLPTRVYPLFQHALDAAEGLSPRDAAARSAALYARLSEVAAGNPIAWQPEVRTAEDIATPRPGNRMVCEPYPLAVNAMPHVDQAAAVLVMAAEEARARGIPEQRWVHVRGGAGASDPRDVLQRTSYDRSPALERAFDRALDAAGVAAGDLDLVDVYSCFPVVPLLVARHLGTGDAVLSATGGHAAFGGPLSSYSLHAVAAATRRLRAGGGTAAVHANGGYLTEQHVVVLAAAAHPDGYAGRPDPEVLDGRGAPPHRPAAEVARAGGADGPDEDGVELVVETWTVEHARDGGPAQAVVIGRTAAGERTAAPTAPGDTASAAALSEPSLGDRTLIGQRVRLAATPDGAPAIRPAP